MNSFLLFSLTFETKFFRRRLQILFGITDIDQSTTRRRSHHVHQQRPVLWHHFGVRARPRSAVEKQHCQGTLRRISSAPITFESVCCSAELPPFTHFISIAFFCLDRTFFLNRVRLSSFQSQPFPFFLFFLCCSRSHCFSFIFSSPASRPLVRQSLVLLVFREEKTHEEEVKAWQFWHSRQHSVKQRILDADTKNSSGIVGPIEEVTHNAISFYWNPLESPAKINIAVQCLSTDFSNQKGVKGLPLHVQIDTFDEFRENALPVNRSYCQVKVFCDKGAERKTRDEERRANKRKLSATGSKRSFRLFASPPLTSTVDHKLITS